MSKRKKVVNMKPSMEEAMEEVLGSKVSSPRVKEAMEKAMKEAEDIIVENDENTEAPSPEELESVTFGDKRYAMKDVPEEGIYCIRRIQNLNERAMELQDQLSDMNLAAAGYTNRLSEVLEPIRFEKV